ncbi:hypothetical protein [Deinococcus radiophilus]|uniref:hypothetical protein n=1 Tax=Deinococcus radiophilus TaxID=32062 RepID=UPI00361C93A1
MRSPDFQTLRLTTVGLGIGVLLASLLTLVGYSGFGLPLLLLLALLGLGLTLWSPGRRVLWGPGERGSAVRSRSVYAVGFVGVGSTH